MSHQGMKCISHGSPEKQNQPDCVCVHVCVRDLLKEIGSRDYGG